MNGLKVVCVADIPYVEPLLRPENQQPLTLLQIISIEPRIAEVLIAMKPVRGYIKRLQCYSETKHCLYKLVGWYADKFELRTTQAYDTVIDVVIDILRLG